MDVSTVIAWMLALLGLVAAGLLAWLRVGLLERVKQLELAEQAATKDLAYASEREDQLREEMGRTKQAYESAQQDVTQLRERAAGIVADKESLRRQYQIELASKDALHHQQLDAAGSVHAEKLVAAERIATESEKRLLQMEEKFKSVFNSLASEALSRSNEEFRKFASEVLATQSQRGVAELEKRKVSVEELVRPIAETLRKADESMAAMRREHLATSSTLSEQIRGIGEASQALRMETTNLSKALSKPQVRGQWGEIQLRRVAELAGMVQYCDFQEQMSQRDPDGKLLRPDVVVRLPNSRVVAVDAKTNIDAYVQAATATTPQEQEACLERFTRHVTEQVGKLSKKGYWKEFDGADFVVMFVPGDQFLDAAFARSPDLVERAAEQQIIFASPSTLIGLLRAVALGWREHQVTEQSKELLELGKKLHEQAGTAFEHVNHVGTLLDKTVNAYNKLVSSVETRMLRSLRKMGEMGVKSSKELPEQLPEVVVRTQELEVHAPAPVMPDTTKPLFS